MRSFDAISRRDSNGGHETECCEAAEVLFDTFVATSALGRVVALALGLERRAKARIKRSKPLMSGASRLRAWIR